MQNEESGDWAEEVNASAKVINGQKENSDAAQNPSELEVSVEDAMIIENYDESIIRPIGVPCQSDYECTKEKEKNESDISEKDLNYWGSGDIREQEYINEQEKIIEFAKELEECGNNVEKIVRFMNKIIKDKKGAPRKALGGIFSKIKYRDRGFFRNFTNNPSLRCQHQVEYEKIEQAFHENYKKVANVTFLNRTAKKKARVLINRSLFIAFIRSTDFTLWRHFQITQLLEYGLNYFINPSAERVDYNELGKMCEESFYNCLPSLPSKYEDIPTEIIVRLPKIPIEGREHTYNTVMALRNHFKFDLLPDCYFKKRDQLPEDPKELCEKFKGIFPIKERSKMKEIKKMVDELRKIYYMPSKLPESYFDLPERLPRLPPSFYDLPDQIAKRFPIENDPETIKNAVKFLKERYEFSHLPLDYIMKRVPLPDPQDIEMELAIVLPVDNQEIALELIDKLKKKYVFKIPLGAKWIDPTLRQTRKENLPDLETLAKEFGFKGKIN